MYFNHLAVDITVASGLWTQSISMIAKWMDRICLILHTLESLCKAKEYYPTMCSHQAKYCARTTKVNWTVQLPEKFENAIFLGIFQIPAIG